MRLSKIGPAWLGIAASELFVWTALFFKSGASGTGTLDPQDAAAWAQFAAYPILFSLVGGSGIAIAGLLPWLAVRGSYAMFRAAANRAPGCGFLEAVGGLSLMFNRDNYTDEGLRWVKIHNQCLLGFVGVFFGLGFLALLMWSLEPWL